MNNNERFAETLGEAITLLNCVSLALEELNDEPAAQILLNDSLIEMYPHYAGPLEEIKEDMLRVAETLDDYNVKLTADQ